MKRFWLMTVFVMLFGSLGVGIHSPWSDPFLMAEVALTIGTAFAIAFMTGRILHVADLSIGLWAWERDGRNKRAKLESGGCRPN